ncbi:MAG: A24 family peptidase [Chromatiales bacterium]|nr:A24 family peptidase [Chromatiales bacterium]
MPLNINIDPLLFTLSISLLGLLIGSFLNVVIHRLPKMMDSEWRSQCHSFLEIKDPPKVTHYTLSQPPSHCPKCEHPISAFENIPLISFMLQQGKCRHCGEPISWRYPIIELVSALLSGVIAYHFGITLETLFALPLTWSLIALTVIDLDHQLLPDSITLPFLWLGLLISTQNLFVDMHASIIGAVIGYLSLWSIYWIFKLLTGKEGMGYGDFKLLALFGAWLGWQSLPLILILSAGVGTVVGISLILFKNHQRQQPIPFGPYLASAGWIAMIWGDQITDAYLKWALAA